MSAPTTKTYVSEIELLRRLTKDEMRWIWETVTGEEVFSTPELSYRHDSVSICYGWAIVTIDSKFNVLWSNVSGQTQFHIKDGQAILIKFFVEKGWLDMDKIPSFSEWNEIRDRRLQSGINLTDQYAQEEKKREEKLKKFYFKSARS